MVAELRGTGREFYPPVDPNLARGMDDDPGAPAERGNGVGLPGG